VELKAARSLATVAYEKRVLVSCYDIMITMARSPIYDRTSKTFASGKVNAEKSRYLQYLISTGNENVFQCRKVKESAVSHFRWKKMGEDRALHQHQE
jgi:hypothetical protein